MSDKCPICNSDMSIASEAFQSSASGIHGHTYHCPKCGPYRLESFASAQMNARLDSREKIAALGHWIRSRYEAVAAGPRRGEEPVLLTDDIVTGIIKQSPPSPAEQADKFILWLGSSGRPPGAIVHAQPSEHQFIIGATTPDGFELVVYDLLDKKLLKGLKCNAPGRCGEADVALSMDGWRYYEKLRRGTVDSRKAFMAMEYNKQPLEEIVNSVFRDAVRQTGFDLFVLRDRPVAGLIDNRLRAEIRTARFLIADLTHKNPGAYWEAGYAEGLGKPVIYTCAKKTFEDPEHRPHFNTNHHQTVLWDSGEPETIAKELKSTIRATLPAEAQLTDD